MKKEIGSFGFWKQAARRKRDDEALAGQLGLHFTAGPDGRGINLKKGTMKSRNRVVNSTVGAGACRRAVVTRVFARLDTPPFADGRGGRRRGRAGRS